MTGTDSLTRTVRDLVVANRILAHEEILDGYGHVSVRHPDHPARYLLARSRSPEHVDVADILEFDAYGQPISPTHQPLYLERFIHAAIYSARPDVSAVVHAHTEALLPFGITGVPLVPVFLAASEMGAEVPLWEVRDRFGESTDLMVRDLDRARDLAQILGSNRVALMRGHGYVTAAQSLVHVVRLCVNLARNARVQLLAMQMGPMTALSAGEIRTRAINDPDLNDPNSPTLRRGWDNWATRAGCQHLL